MADRQRGWVALGYGVGDHHPRVRLFNPLGNLCSQRESSRGVKAVIKANNPEGSLGCDDFPATTIAISLLVGFTFMLITEQLLPGPYSPVPVSRSPSTVDADVGPEELKGFVSASAPRHPATRTVIGDGSKISISVPVSVSGKGFALVLGLVLHALSDGLALGSSMVADADSGVIVFGVLAFLRGMTAIRICRVAVCFVNSNGLQHSPRLA
jgi:zinc transporter ZupT